ncbi:hypothetical protein GCK32_011971 [Trichostrongylus colubriformis]|uniref:Uncharacterized protein n=1 Tax=Trichostrongylus colubriformis TaxID=6319 RepID=A0AAN8I859_TRICO
MAVFVATSVFLFLSLLLTVILVEYFTRISSREDFLKQFRGDWFLTSTEEDGRIHMTKITPIENIPFRGGRLLLDEVESYCLKEHAHLASILSDEEATRIAREETSILIDHY